MCGRYSLEIPKNIDKRFKLKKPLPLLKNRYNIAPGEIMPVIVRRGVNEINLMKWGLIPFWAKDPKIGYQMINARSETLASKPSFRKPLISQRCIVPATGFYEWQKIPKGKTPYYVHLIKEPIFSFAGLFDKWKDAAGIEIQTYTIITTPPNPLLERIHNRMPAILSQEQEDVWLNPDLKDPQQLLSLLKPYSSAEMETYPVSLLVNKPQNDFPDLIKKASLF